MKRIYFCYPGDSGCSYNRILLPVRYCSEDFLKVGCEFHIGDGLPPGFDAYVLTGLPNEQTFLQINRLIYQKKQFIWSIDDDWTTIPSWNPAKPSENNLAVFDALKKVCDWIYVSTPTLAETFADVREKVFVTPNLIDLETFPTFPYTVNESGRREYQLEVKFPIKIVWVGSLTHRGDIELLDEAICEILSRHSMDQVVVVFQGMMPPTRCTTRYLHRGLFFQPTVPFASYQTVLNSIEPNIYLAPLAPIPFNLSKSNLRIIEGWSLMAAPIASSWGEYSTIKHREDGLLVQKPEDWVKHMDELIQDHALRLTLAANGRQRVEYEYSWNNKVCRKPWYDCFSKMFDVENPYHEFSS